MHTSQVLPLSKYSGSNDNKTFKEWYEKFEIVANVCGWDSQSMSQKFTPVRTQSVKSGLFHSRGQKVNERVDDYAQDFNRLCQKAYPQANYGSQ